MLTWLFGWKGLAIGAVALTVVGFTGGWRVRDAFCDAAAAKAQLRILETQLRARDAAALEDQKRAEADAAIKLELEGAVRELEGKISSGVCFGADDTDRLRSLWRK